ncbi:hypothetical protein B0T26DRAFT_757192 [Lasiosphaeria miniovina]|uniref:Uncharacterized protein n=1 Tax=Lasiosphaeria miniovina TaxID=1954250 RepID=A0AA39ZUC9_9PEZI|nr:uncharacterized protein B0T26DRAFT_757192 [Lasiosphaeria miniovina]KAK0703675.1 hypothetical protein B0T26DRAFT_757192 [Lasiosphaeria miniovina]
MSWLRTTALSVTGIAANLQLPAQPLQLPSLHSKTIDLTGLAATVQTLSLTSDVLCFHRRLRIACMSLANPGALKHLAVEAGWLLGDRPKLYSHTGPGSAEAAPSRDLAGLLPPSLETFRLIVFDVGKDQNCSYYATDVKLSPRPPCSDPCHVHFKTGVRDWKKLDAALKPLFAKVRVKFSVTYQDTAPERLLSWREAPEVQ